MNKKAIHVLQLISSLEVGGSEKLLLELLRASRNDKRLSFVVVVMNQHVNAGMRDELEETGYPVYYLSRPEGHRHPRYLRRLLSIIRQHDIDIVHAHNHGGKFWSVLCKLFHPRLHLVFTIHDTLTREMDSVQRFVHKHLITTNVAISRTVAELCQRQGLDNYRQIYNGIPLERFVNAKRASLQKRLSLASFEKEPLRILNVGRLWHEIKGQDVLIRAVALCRKAGLNVHARLMGSVCDYNRESFRSLQELVQELELSEHIEFLVNRTDVPKQLAWADLFVLPSRFEGLGLVILEAMAAGVPVIASRIDGPAELITHSVNGALFESENAQDLFEQIEQLYYHPERADAMRAHASNGVQSFDVQVMQGHYRQLYEDLQEGGERIGGSLSDQPAMLRRIGDGASL